MRNTIRAILFLMTVWLLSGCFVVVNDGDKTSVIGSRKEHALDTLKKIEETQPEAKKEIRLFGK